MYKDFIGIPFVDGGRDKNGSDCWGLLSQVFSVYDINVPDYSISCENTCLISRRVHTERESSWERLDKPTVPCLVLMALDRTRPLLLNHVGVYVGGNKFIHTIKKQNSKLESIYHPFYKNVIEGYYTYVGK